MNKHRSASPFEAARPICLIRKVFLQGSQQKRPELAFQSVNPVQGLMLNQVKEKTLHQVLRFFGRMPAIPDKRVKRVPIEFAKIGESFLGARRLALRRNQY
jgi:hypothetical protein